MPPPSQLDITPEEFDVLFPFYEDVDDSLLEDLENLPPDLQLKALKMKNARKQQLKSTSAVYHVNQQMEVLAIFLTESAHARRNEPRMKPIRQEILCLLKVWDAFRYHTHEIYYYRHAFRERSIKGIRRLKAYLRNQIKLAFRHGNGTSPFAEDLKLLVVAINVMQAHVYDIPCKGLPLPSQHVTVEELDRRLATNRLGCL